MSATVWFEEQTEQFETHAISVAQKNFPTCSHTETVGKTHRLSTKLSVFNQPQFVAQSGVHESVSGQ
jgi:hypothetical protein